MDTIAKIILWAMLSVFGVGIADTAIELQKQTIRAYQKGPISAGLFTRLMTEDRKK